VQHEIGGNAAAPKVVGDIWDARLKWHPRSWAFAGG